MSPTKRGYDIASLPIFSLNYYLSRFKHVKFAGEASDEGTDTDGWEEEDEAEPKVQCLYKIIVCLM